MFELEAKAQAVEAALLVHCIRPWGPRARQTHLWCGSVGARNFTADWSRVTCPDCHAVHRGTMRSVP